MKAISKADFAGFVDKVIASTRGEVAGVVARDGKYAFAPLQSASQLVLDYDVTLQSPKKYFLPESETLVRYGRSGGSQALEVEPVNESIPRIIIGIHPYDLIAIEQLDKIYGGKGADPNYMAKRNKAVLIGVRMSRASDRSFAHSMGCADTESGYDLMLTDIGNSYAVEVGSAAGRKLLEKYAAARDATPADEQAVKAAREKAAGLFKKKINMAPADLPKMLENGFADPVWKELSAKCFSCGTCNLVCPTCYCFDVRDETEIGLNKGERRRYWDGCLLRDFTAIATGEVFREHREDRFRHRLMRKGRYIKERYGYIACVGCGRCSSACVPDIADPTVIFNRIEASQKQGAK